jgi:Cu(I)/Ag(I) efflux system membrane fusion protein
VSQDPPVFDPTSRTLKLRLEAQNPDLLLRPDMFVDLEFSTPAPPGVSIPQEAILDSGMQKVVYVETSEGVFEPRRVTVGTAYGDSSTVTSGLRFGERIVIAGNFLIDSESRLHSSQRSSSSQNPARSAAARVEVGNLSRRAPIRRRATGPAKQRVERKAARLGGTERRARTHAQVLGAQRGAHA